jgi:hypothetical protein
MAILVRVARVVGGFADVLLNLADIFLHIAGYFLTLVARDFAGRLFYRTLDFVLGTFNAIVIHAVSPE